MKRGSLRVRLLSAHVLITVGTVSLLLIIGNALLARTIANDQHQRITERLDAEVAALSVQNGTIQVRETLNDQSLDLYSWVYHAGRFINGQNPGPPNLDVVVRQLIRSGSATRLIHHGGLLFGARRIQTSPHDAAPTTIVAAVSVSDLSRLRRSVLVASFIVGLLLTLIAALTLRRVLTQALMTVDEMTTAAAEWEAHDFDRRFGLGPPRDEITALAATLDRLLGRIAASRRREQRLAAEIAHELRTPLSSIRATAELSMGASRETLEIALKGIVADSERLSATISNLVAQARNELQPPHRGADLGEVMSEFESVAAIETSSDLPRVEGDPRILRQLFLPIITNARQHAASQVVVQLRTDGDTVRALIRDDGPGVDPDLGVRAFIAGARGLAEPDGGSGLGLSLAKRLAGACGGTVQLGEGPGGCFVVTLPQAQQLGPSDARDRPL